MPAKLLHVDITYIQQCILNGEVLYMLMFTAFWLNLLVSVTTNLWKPYFGSQTDLFGRTPPDS